MISVYPDQEEFINEIRKLWKSNLRIIGMAQTGFGKTRVAAKIIDSMSKRGMSICFLVPRITLIEQTVRSFVDLGIESITVMHGQAEVDMNASVTIASIDTYIRRAKRTFDLVIVDEAHHRRMQLLKWMEEHPEERYLGLTATPYADWIGEYYTALAKGRSMKWLIENKRLAPYDVYAPTKPDTSNLKTRNGAYGKDFAESDLEQIMGDNKVVGDIVQNWLQNGEDRLTMGLCVNVRHANQICNEFNAVGVMAEVVSAKVPLEEREIIFKRMRDGITKVVLSVDCLTEGFDLPEVTCLINARPTKSVARWLQGAGRALRYLPGKKAVIFDHSGTALDLGLPEYIDIDQLKNGDDNKETKTRQVEREQHEKKPKECKKCNYLKPAGIYECPRCGFKPLAGEDVETDKDRELVKIKGKEKKWTMEEKQSWYSMFLGQCKTKGYKEGWAANKYKEKFGVWPKGLKRTPKAASPEFNAYIKHLNIKFAKSKKAKSYRAEQEQLLGNWK